ncbi:CBN-NEX-2 protein [Aphelenchoides avenae]|nr:CBN-NEX-2 protein [Aphelenchus avenae]
MVHGHPTIRPVSHANPKHDAEALHKAFKGLGCDKKEVVRILTSRTNHQRQEIAREYKILYGKDLYDKLKDELSGDLEELCLGLMETPAKYLAHQLRKAMKGAGTRENVLIEILSTHTNHDINEIKHAYKHLYDRDLEHDVSSETSGDFKHLLISLLCAARDESHHVDTHKANEDAHALLRAGEQRAGTDESVFNKIFAVQSFSQLRHIFEEYQKVTNHPIDTAIEKEFNGDARAAFEALVKVVRNRIAFFAEQLHNSMKGLGTRDTDLIRLVVSRAEIDLEDIRHEYQKLYGISLEKAIQDETSGAYKDALIALVHGN